MFEKSSDEEIVELRDEIFEEVDIPYRFEERI